MAKRFINRASDAAKEISADRYYRENLSPWERLCYGIQTVAPPGVMVSGVIAAASPQVTEIALAASGLLMLGYALTKAKHEWPLCVPSFATTAPGWYQSMYRYLKLIKPVVRALPGQKERLKAPAEMPGDGIIYLGSDTDNGNAQIWTSLDLCVRHMLLIGTTGSGKTQVILGLLSQLMAQGSGGIFVDGKADVTTWFFLYTLARHFGLERQLLVINYLTAGGDGTKRSNTTNVFEVATPDALNEMMSSMMGGGGEGGNDDMWRGRAEALFSLVIRAACEDRDQRGRTIVPDDLREMMALGNLLEMPTKAEYSTRVRREAELFLNDLPGYSAYVKAGTPQVKEQCLGRMSEQVGFLQMQFTRVLSLLAGTYGYITGADISEIDWLDVINQRRTLYVMLPALEKSPESLKQLGRMVVTALRNAVLPVVGGGTLTGSKRLLVDARPIGTRVPYGIFLDEYGSYCVEGFGDVVAQIRSMGIFACFAGQDWSSFKKGSEIEAGRVNSNTGTKIFLKSFDADTVQLLVETAGKKLVAVASNWGTRKASAQYDKVDSLSVQEVERVRIDQLAQQEPGMAHVYYGGRLWTKVKMFYPAIKQAANSQVNSFVRMRTPVGLSGKIEEVENKILAKRMLEQWQAKCVEHSTARLTLPEGQEQTYRLFSGWSDSLVQSLTTGRNADLFDVMTKAALSMNEKPAPAAAAAAPSVVEATLPTTPSEVLRAEAPGVQDMILPPPPLTTQDAGNPWSLDEVADKPILEGAARSALTATLIDRAQQLEQQGATAVWSTDVEIARATANTAVANSVPAADGSNYPEQPLPHAMDGQGLRGSLTAMLELLRAVQKTDGEEGAEGATS